MSKAVSSKKQPQRPGSSKNPPPTHDKKKDTAVVKSVSELQKENDALKFRIEFLEKQFDPKVFEKNAGQSVQHTFNTLVQDALKSAEETIVKLRNGNSSNENNGELNKAKDEIKELTYKLKQKATTEETLKLDLQTAQSERDDLKKQLTEARPTTVSEKKTSTGSTEQLNIANDKIKDLNNMLEQNKEQLNKANDKIKELNNMLEQKETECENRKRELKKAQSELDNLPKKETYARRSSDEVESSKIATLKENLKKSSQEIDRLNADLETEKKKRAQEIDRIKAELNTANENKDTEIASLKKHVEELKTTTNQSSGSIDTKTLQKQLEQNKQEIDRLSSELGGVKKNLEIKKEEVLSLKDEKKAIESVYRSQLTTLKSIRESQKNSSKTNTEMQDKIEFMEKKIKDKDTEIGKKTSEIDGLKNEIADLKKACHDAFVKLETKERETKKLEEDYKKKINQKEESLSRPDIQDLSDSNRPSELAKRLFELYDNEWANCYETVRKQFSTEQSAVQMLLRTCVKIYNSCTLIATSDVHDLQRAFSTFSEKDDVLLIQIKQRRKRARQVDIDLKRITQGINDNVADILGPDLIRNVHVRAFWVKCLEICWLMVIQDPPVYMDIEIDKQGQMFDHAAYRSYTQTGYEFDYVVWPALYTHQGGDILHKGVAQGRESSDSVGGKRRGILVKN